MSATVLDMSMSLDGFVTGPNAGPDNGLGDGGHRLHEWALTNGEADHKEIERPAGVNGEVFDEMMSTGAVVAGRGTFEPAGGWGGDHHDGVPIFILTMARAKEAAGDRNVLVHGVGTARLALAAGVLDELELHLIPVLFGQGRRLFGERDAEQIELERTRVLEGEAGVTHVHYRVLR